MSRYIEYRTTEWFGLEGTFEDHLVQPPCHGLGHLPLDQAAQSPIHPGLEHFQGGGIHNFFGQLVPVSHHAHHKKFCLLTRPIKKTELASDVRVLTF